MGLSAKCQHSVTLFARLLDEIELAHLASSQQMLAAVQCSANPAGLGF
jgi:hypothetical protein